MSGETGRALAAEAVAPPVSDIVRPECESCDFCTLDLVRSGDEFEIVEVDDTHARIQALRFGMAEGACVKCVTRIPAGPVVLKSGRQEIAVGRSLAKRITVRRRATDE